MQDRWYVKIRQNLDVYVNNYETAHINITRLYNYLISDNVQRCCALDPYNQINDLPKSMNCFIESGDGEYFENLSTCFGMFSFELL